MRGPSPSAPGLRAMSCPGRPAASPSLRCDQRRAERVDPSGEEPSGPVPLVDDDAVEPLLQLERNGTPPAPRAPRRAARTGATGGTGATVRPWADRRRGRGRSRRRRPLLRTAAPSAAPSRPSAPGVAQRRLRGRELRQPFRDQSAARREPSGEEEAARQRRHRDAFAVPQRGDGPPARLHHAAALSGEARRGRPSRPRGARVAAAAENAPAPRREAARPRAGGMERRKTPASAHSAGVFGSETHVHGVRSMALRGGAFRAAPRVFDEGLGRGSVRASPPRGGHSVVGRSVVKTAAGAHGGSSPAK